MIAKGIFKQLSSKYDTATWASSLLRDWLNNDFYNDNFTDIEKTLITNELYADKVFLLSIDEANEYFSSDAARKCKPRWSDDYEHWWLRSQGEKDNYAAIVTAGGEVLTRGFGADNPLPHVRPVMWIDIGS